jgi:hypothetical protein
MKRFSSCLITHYIDKEGDIRFNKTVAELKAEQMIKLPIMLSERLASGGIGGGVERQATE